MRIDVHASVGHWPFRQLRGNDCPGLIGQMDRYGIDQAVVANLHGVFYMNAQAANEELAVEIEPYRGRLIPCAVLNPTYAAWREDLECCRRRFAMRGVRLFPQYHGYALQDSACLEMVRAARDLEMVVAFCLRLVDDRQRSWLDASRDLDMNEILAVVAQVPDARYMILNSRPDQLRPEGIEVARQADVIFDTVRGCGCGVVGFTQYDLREAIGTYGIERFAFGSAAPLQDYASALLRVQHLVGCTEQQREQVWSANAHRLLSDATSGA